MEVRAGDELVIFDMGSGLRPLGESLAGRAVRGTIFLSHYHWDHIQGLPFFTAAYNPANSFDIYAPPRGDQSPKEILSGQMVAPYFPVPMSILGARLDFKPVVSGDEVWLGETRVLARELNHPNGALGYRIEMDGAALVYATDHEHGTRSDEALIELSRGADALILDSMYTPAEYSGTKGPKRTGWGHSTWDAGVEIVRKAGVKRFFLFHHEPSRSDDELDALLAKARELFPETYAAREGDRHEIS